MIGERLAEVRKDHGDRQDDLARKLNVTKFTISNWEQEKCVPPHEAIVQICRLYHVSADYLLGVTDEDPTYSRERRAARFTAEELAELKQLEQYLLWRRKQQRESTT